MAGGDAKVLDTKETLDEGEALLSTDDCELILIMSKGPHNELPPWLLCLLMETLEKVGWMGSSPVIGVVADWEKEEPGARVWRGEEKGR